jgi:GNAT superfamily N-acetyltransferase
LAAHRYHFDERYRERTELADGTRVELRVVGPADRELLRRGFDRLSGRSRYQRFMGVKAQLSDAELDMLTSLDGTNRFGIGAVRLGAGAEPEGLGVARFARLPDDPAVAEAAVTVVDGAQRRGLGSLLLRRLAAAARERGVTRFRAEILASNEPMRRLLAAHVDATVEADGDVVRVLVELPSFSSLMKRPVAGGDLLGRLLAQAAGGGITVRLGDVLLKRR